MAKIVMGARKKELRAWRENEREDSERKCSQSQKHVPRLLTNPHVLVQRSLRCARGIHCEYVHLVILYTEKISSFTASVGLAQARPNEVDFNLSSRYIATSKSLYCDLPSTSSLRHLYIGALKSCSNVGALKTVQCTVVVNSGL